MERRIIGVLSPKASGSITITENGNYDVVDVANAVVDVRPSGTIEITENGEHDVANYEKANVNVVDEESAINLETLQILVDEWATASYRLFKGADIKTIPKSIDFGKVEQTSYFSSCNMLEKVDGINTKNVKSLEGWFSNCNNLKYLFNIDCSSATSIRSICEMSPQLIEAQFINTDNITTIYSAFYECASLEKLELDGALIDDMQQAFYGCIKLKELRFKKARPSNLTSCFANCDSLKTLELNLINATSFYLRAEYLENLYLYNIKISLEIATSAGYGYYINKESLIHTIQELIDTGSSKTLTMKSTNINKIANVYVKVISEAPDENGNVKLPFEVCESTDEGAMLITNYVSLKNWALA